MSAANNNFGRRQCQMSDFRCQTWLHLAVPDCTWLYLALPERSHRIFGHIMTEDMFVFGHNMTEDMFVFGHIMTEDYGDGDGDGDGQSVSQSVSVSEVLYPKDGRAQHRARLCSYHYFGKRRRVV